MTTRLSIFYVHPAATAGYGSNLNCRGLRCVQLLHAAWREVTDEFAALTEGTLNVQLCTVALQNMFDDSETEA